MADTAHPTQKLLDEMKRRFPELANDSPLFGAEAVERLGDWFTQLQNESTPADDPSDGLGEAIRLDCIEAARTLFDIDDGIDVDDAHLSVGDDVVWVSAWVVLTGDTLPASARRVVEAPASD